MTPPDGPGPAGAANRVAKIIAERFDWAAGADGTARLREDLDLDSLHLVELQVAVEDEFGVVFDPTDERLLDAFQTIGSLGSYVDHLLEESS